jgi:hypothetical protein
MNGDKESTDPGYVNRNEQVVFYETGLQGLDGRRYVYALGCSECGAVYGAYGSDVFQRKCPNPKCDEGGGEPGTPLQGRVRLF